MPSRREIGDLVLNEREARTSNESVGEEDGVEERARGGTGRPGERRNRVLAEVDGGGWSDGGGSVETDVGGGWPGPKWLCDVGTGVGEGGELVLRGGGGVGVLLFGGSQKKGPVGR